MIATTAALRRLVRRKVRPAMPGPALRGAHVELLLAVESEPGLGVAAAARTLHLAANSVSTLVNELTDAGMLLREPDPGDRRAARLYLTEAARTRLVAWRQARAELVGGGLARLPAPDREAIARALPALRALLDVLCEGKGR